MVGLSHRQSLRSIARQLDHNVSVLSREIQANTTEEGKYQAYWAENRSRIRRKTSRKRERIADYDIRDYVETHIRRGWSPQQIAGRLSIDIPGKKVSHETIYQFIFKNRRDLTQYLHCGRKRRRKRKNTRQKRVMIPDRVSIDQRPLSATQRADYGHWEADTAISRQSKESLMILQERTLGLTYISKLSRCAPKEMADAVLERLRCFHPKMRKSVTFDNGQENRHHRRLHDELGIKTYFCDPYSPWQKGSVENAIGLIRYFLPKKTDFALYSKEHIDSIEMSLNSRPRKRFGYLTPIENTLRVALSG
jgi:IS30 family transposase